MSHPTNRKYPTERRTVTFDFSEKMAVAAGETLSTVTITVPGGITSSSPTTSGPLVSTRIGGGTAGEDYDIVCEVITSQSQTLRLVFTLEVRDDAN
jgi:hypothetical protein